MSKKITVTVTNDEGEEVESKLPAKTEVCHKCDGEGTHLTPSIGEHAYSQEEFEESFDEEGREEYFRRGGIYDVTCTVCKGKNVVLVVDREHIKAHGTTEEKETLKVYEEQEKEEEEYRRECAMERRMEEWEPSY